MNKQEVLEVQIVDSVTDKVGLVEEAVDLRWVAREDEDREDKGGEDVGEVLRKALVAQREVKQQKLLCAHEAGMMATHAVNLMIQFLPACDPGIHLPDAFLPSGPVNFFQVIFSADGGAIQLGLLTVVLLI